MSFPGLIVIVQLSLIEYSQSQYSVHSALLFLRSYASSSTEFN